MAIQQTFDFLDEPATALPAGRGSDLPGGRGSYRAVQPRPSQSAQCDTRTTGSAGTSPSQAIGSAGASPSQTNGNSPPSPPRSDQRNPIDRLRDQIGCINTARSDDRTETFSTGSPSIDNLLPQTGLRNDCVTEWVAEQDGCGAAALSLIAAATRLRSLDVTGPLVVVCSPDQFYPPAAVALGVPPQRIIWVRPTKHADVVWSVDQALRSSATAVVWAPIAARLDDRDARRFQLAAETGKTPGLFVRPAAVRGRPTFADIRLHIASETSASQIHTSNRALQITLDRCRGGQTGRQTTVEINDHGGIESTIVAAKESHQDDTLPLHLASQLARVAPTRTAPTGRQRTGQRPAEPQRLGRHRSA